MSESKREWVCLILAGIGSVRTRRLLECFGSVEKVFKATRAELRNAGIPDAVASRIVSWEKLPWEQEIAEADREGISIITLDDPRYPPLLAGIPDPPPVLFVRGTLCSEDTFSLGIVGTRNPSPYGIRMAEKFARELAELGVTIVSGLARGIDTHAHLGALQARGRTIGILGSGLLNFYPAENRKLSEKMVSHGAVISEFPLHTAPLPQNFPQRNRIISGLSRGTLVVEAGPGSGALITAHSALDQNREVFALPGQIDTITSKGANLLLQEGAKLVQHLNDIIEEMGWERRKVPSSPPAPEIPAHAPTPEEAALLACIGDGAMHVEEILRKSSLSYPRIVSLLVSLELKGLVRAFPGNLYRKGC